MNATFLPSVRKIRPIYWSPLPRNWDYFYYFSGFSILQDAIDRALINAVAGEDVQEPGTFASQFPSPCYLYDTFLFTNSVILPLCMTISFVYPAAIFVQNMVAEKENRLKEFMKVMGLSNFVHGLAWFITAFVQLTFSMTVVTFILRYMQVLLHSDPFIIWILLELYAIATITLAFLVSSLFSKAKIASATAGMLYFISYVPAMCISIREDISGGNIPPAFKYIASFFSTSAFGLSCKYISLRESEGIGVQWTNINESPIERDEFSLLIAFLYLFIDSIIYSTLAWYIEQVHPGSYGIPKPWYFPFTKNFWTGNPGVDVDYEMPKIFIQFWTSLRQLFSRSQLLIEDDIEINQDYVNDSHFERLPNNLKVGVEISKMSKVYRETGKIAVDNLSLKLYESQITGLLGHNGAGKTTTMSILTGVLPPTSGSVKVYGWDIGKNLETIRHSLGYCPQHNVLFEHMTPEEHLWFYSGLKQESKQQIGEDVEKMLNDVGLILKRSTPVNQLSGGMKRKLSIALAFVGKSRLVVLDEPTAGVDPYSRRAIWDLIIHYKENRTILLTTHHMDEADMLSDRIAIISKGRVQCCGSSLFLRNTFCEGYNLICVRKKSTNVEKVADFIRNYIKNAFLKRESRHELHFVLPYKEIDNFSTFFTELYKIKEDDMVISCFGLFDSTLEEAFLEITKSNEQNDLLEKFYNDTKGHRRQPSTDSKLDKHSARHHDVTSLLSNDRFQPAHPVNIHGQGALKPSVALYWKQFRALMIKRIIHVKRNRKLLFSQIILPAIFVSIAMSMALSAPLFGDPGPFDLSPDQYHNSTLPKGFFTPITNYKANGPHRPSEASFTPGLAASCLAEDRFSQEFSEECRRMYSVSAFSLPKFTFSNSSGKRYYPSCSCLADFSGEICDNNYTGAPLYRTASESYIFDIGNEKMTSYLINTEQFYRRHRYGAIAFGNDLNHVPKNFGKQDPVLKSLVVREATNYFFEHRGFHSVPAYLNAVNNLLLRSTVSKTPNLGNPAAYGITTYNHPINGTDKVDSQELM